MMIVSGSMAVWFGGFFEPSSRDCYLAQSAVQALVGFFGTAWLTAKFQGPRPWRFLGATQRVSWRPFLGVPIVFILGMPFLNQLIYYNSEMTLPSSMHGLEETMRQMEESAGKFTETILGDPSIGALVSGILLVGVLTGFAEEMLFRGALQRTLAIDRRLSQWSIWISAFLFSAIHLQFFGFFPRLLLGAFFGYILFSTGSIWPAVYGHALNNSLVVVTYWIGLRNPDFPDAQMLGVVENGFPVWGSISLAALVLFFLFAYKWFFNRKQDNLTFDDTSGKGVPDGR